MPSDLTVNATSASQTSSGNSLNSAASLAASTPDSTATATTQASSAASTSPEKVLGPSPVSHLDAALGIVVIEFLNAQGHVQSSIPTQKQIDAFQQSQDSHTRSGDQTVVGR